jgi:hypothetical protein
MREKVTAIGVKKESWLFIAAMLTIHAFLAWYSADYLREGYADFTIFYTAGRILHEGPRSSLYDGNLQYRLQKQFAPNVKTRQAALPYNHPPFEALLFVPLILLSYVHAYVVWNLFNLAFLCVIPFVLRDHVALLRRHPPWFWVLSILAFFPIFMTLIQGQDSVLLLLIFSSTFAFLKKNADFLAGCCLALGLFRFHMVLPLALILLLRGKKSAILGFASVAACWLIVSAGLVGWSTVLHYPQYVIHLETAGAGGAIAPVKMPTIHGLLDPITAPYLGKITSATLIAIFSFLFILIGALCWPNKNVRTNFDLSFSIVVLITVLVSYHAYAHDLSILFLPLLLVANYVSETSWPAGQRNLNMLLPMFLLCLSPLYLLLWFHYQHLNLIGLVLVWWFLVLWWEIRQKSKTISLDYPEHSEK